MDWKWDFTGDGVWDAYGETVAWQFEKPGPVRVTHEATNDCSGNTKGSMTKVLTVDVPDPARAGSDIAVDAQDTSTAPAESNCTALASAFAAQWSTGPYARVPVMSDAPIVLSTASGLLLMKPDPSIAAANVARPTAHGVAVRIVGSSDWTLDLVKGQELRKVDAQRVVLIDALGIPAAEIRVQSDDEVPPAALEPHPNGTGVHVSASVPVELEAVPTDEGAPEVLRDPVCAASSSGSSPDTPPAEPSDGTTMATAAAAKCPFGIIRPFRTGVRTANGRTTISCEPHARAFYVEAYSYLWSWRGGRTWRLRGAAFDFGVLGFGAVATPRALCTRGYENQVWATAGAVAVYSFLKPYVRKSAGQLLGVLDCA